VRWTEPLRLHPCLYYCELGFIRYWVRSGETEKQLPTRKNGVSSCVPSRIRTSETYVIRRLRGFNAKSPNPNVK